MKNLSGPRAKHREVTLMQQTFAPFHLQSEIQNTIPTADAVGGGSSNPMGVYHYKKW